MTFQGFSGIPWQKTNQMITPAISGIPEFYAPCIKKFLMPQEYVAEILTVILHFKKCENTCFFILSKFAWGMPYPLPQYDYISDLLKRYRNTKHYL